MSNQILDIGVHWVVEPTHQIPLLKQNSDISSQQVLKQWGATTFQTFRTALQLGSVAQAVLGPDGWKSFPK